MIISNQRIRLAIDTAQMGTINDVLTGATPQFWNSVDVQFELAIFYGATLAAVSNIDSITVDLKAGDPRTGLPLMSRTIDSASLNPSLTPEAWQAGAASDCHAIVTFTNQETNLDLNSETETFWLVVSALTKDTPTHKLVLGATPLNAMESGQGIEPPASVVSPNYYTAAQSDARFQLSVDLTGINTHLGTLDTSVATAQSTASAALPKAGGTMSGALTITGLSGVLKATSGLVSASATTSDLAEGSRLYWTQARFDTALAAISGTANGVCPLDASSLIPAVYLPSITVHNTFVVASQSAMLALAAHQGDVAIRTDLNKSYILTNNTPSVLGNWSELLTPTSAVTSVNSQTGAVTLTTSNVAEGSNLYHTTARAAAAALAAALSGLSTGTGGNLTSGDTVLSALGRLENRTALNDAKVTGSDRVLKTGDTMTGALQFSGASNAGVILNNLTDTQRAALTPTAGMIIYNTTLSQAMIYNGSWQGLALGNGSIWFQGAGAPASTLGTNGAYYLNVTTGDIYLKTSGTWAIIYSPFSASGGTFTGTITSTAAVPLQSNSDWRLYNDGAGGFDIEFPASSGGWLNAFSFSADGSKGTLTIPAGFLNVSASSGHAYRVNGIDVVGVQQAHIAHDTSGTATGTVVNNILNALEAHGLIHN